MITFIKNEDLHFVAFDTTAGWTERYQVGLNTLLSEEKNPVLLPPEIRDQTHHLMIVSDYWIGNASYQFRSRKRSLAEPFIERKLLADHPEIPRIKYFYDFLFEMKHDDGPSLYAHFLQEPRFFDLYDRLTELDLAPRHVTTPAFLWEKWLGKGISQSNEGGKGLVHLLPTECFLYFFNRGRYLFSRSIIIPEDRPGTPQILELLSYEIAQSGYLFSQKAKTEVDQFYLASAPEITPQDLAETLGKDVKGLDIADQAISKDTEMIRFLGPAALFDPKDLAEAEGFLSISHRQLRQELSWRPVQVRGMVAGLVIVFLLVIEALFLWVGHRPNLSLADQQGENSARRQAIQQYNQALDLILADSAHQRPENVINNIAMSLPEHVRIKEITIDTETQPGVEIQGMITASGPYHFKETLSTFISNLNNNMHGTRMINIQDVDFKAADNSMNQPYQDYLIHLKMDLP